MTTALPKQIGKYSIRGVLGRGGMGVVYDAEHDGKRVAIKTVLGLRTKYVQAVRREIHALARLRHPGVVAIVDEGTHEGAPWYAMEFVAGVTLRAWANSLAPQSKTETQTAPPEPHTQSATDGTSAGADEGVAESFVAALRTGILASDAPTLTHSGKAFEANPDAAVDPSIDHMAPQDLEEESAGSSSGGTSRRRLLRRGEPASPETLPAILRVMRRLCVTLDYLHGEGLIHRDLKPDNVIVRPDGTPVIVDFGLVFHSTGISSRESIDELANVGAGTATYMAPEQIRGDGVDARADLYSLGCILYELIRGRAPFIGTTSLQILNQHLTAQHEPLKKSMPWLVDSVDDLVSDLLEKKPRNRIGHAKTIAHRLAWIASLDPEQFGADARPYLYRPALSGRAPVLDALHRKLKNLDREGGVALLVGESGVGKTRLALEAARRAADVGAVVLAGEATRQGGVPLGPLRKVLQFVSETCTIGGRERTSVILGGGRAKLFAAYEPSLVVVPGFEVLPDPEPLPAPEARKRLLESLLDTIDTLASDQPLLVIVDDVQWADELTIGFLEHLASAERKGPVLVLGTVRSGEGDDLVLTLEDKPGTALYRLDRLAPEAVREVIEDALGGATIDDALVAFIDRHSGGIPLFVTEYVHAAVEHGLLERDEAGSWRSTARDPRSLPTSLTELLARRLRVLPEKARQVAFALAVLGRSQEIAILEKTSGLFDLELLEAITELRYRQLIDDDSDGAVRFAHDKLMEAAYATIEDKQRAALHGRAADALEALPPLLREERAEALAYHHDAAGRPERAVAHLLVAGDRARGLSAHKDAERCYERAVALFEKIGDVQGLAKTLMKLGLVHAANFDATAAQRAYQRAFSLWSELRTVSGPAATPTARVRVTNQPRTLDPAYSNDSDSLFVLAQLFEGLVELDVDSNVLPAVATSWDISEDGLVYTFHLREDARFSDGSNVTALDFEASWKRTLAPRTRSPSAQLLYPIANARAFHEGRTKDLMDVGVSAVDERTLEVRLASPSAFFLHLLSHPVAFPIPRRAIMEHGRAWTQAGNMVSNGAFILEDRQPLQITLRRNALYTGRAEGNVLEIEVNFIRTYRDCLVLYDRGELDILDMIAADADVLAEARRRYPTELRFTPLHSTQYAALRADRPPLDDVRVRKALALAIDREALEKRLAGTAHAAARGGFIAPGVAAHSPVLALRYDPERAAALLAEAGYSTPRSLPPLSWLHTHGLGDTTLLEFVREQWSILGVRTELLEVGWEEFERALRASPPHVMLGGWIADYPDPDAFLRTTFHSADGAEQIGWSDARFDDLVESAARTPDQRARNDLYAAADHLLVAEHAVVVPLSYGQNPVLLRPKIRYFPNAGTYLRPMKMVLVEE